jgi:CheY-like chemotaxis protein
LVDDALAETSLSIPANKILNKKRPIILVTEDEAYSYLLFELTRDKDYEIIRAEDGEEAVELCKLIPNIQLVLMDLKMPKMNGLVATQEIKKLRDNLPVIALTAYAETGIHQKCMDAGFDETWQNQLVKRSYLKKFRSFYLRFRGSCSKPVEQTS